MEVLAWMFIFIVCLALGISVGVCCCRRWCGHEANVDINVPLNPQVHPMMTKDDVQQTQIDVQQTQPQQPQPQHKAKINDNVASYVMSHHKKFGFTTPYPYKLIRDLSTKYDPRIRQLYRYDSEFTRNLVEHALRYVLTCDGVDCDGKAYEVFNQLKTSEVMNNIFSEYVEGGIISSIVEYLMDVKWILKLNEVYYNVPMGNVETPLYILHDNIDLITSDKLIRVKCVEQRSNGCDIYEQGIYERLYIQSLYTNKEIKYSSENMELCVLNLLTNELVVYDKVRLKLV